MTPHLRVAPGVLVVAAVAATAPFAFLLAYALVWSACSALDVPGTVATWLSFASVSVATGAFPLCRKDEHADLSRAPLSRQQDLKALVDAIVLWARQGIPTTP